MEGEGAVALFARSFEKRRLRYTACIGCIARRIDLFVMLRRMDH